MIDHFLEFETVAEPNLLDPDVVFDEFAFSGLVDSAGELLHTP